MNHVSVSAAGSETVSSGLTFKQAVVYFIYALQTATVMSWFMLAMIAYPDVQKKCQAELDRVIGRSHMPTLEDRARLPYIRATLREALRWRTVTPVGGSTT